MKIKKTLMEVNLIKIKNSSKIKKKQMFLVLTILKRKQVLSKTPTTIWVKRVLRMITGDINNKKWIKCKINIHNNSYQNGSLKRCKVMLE